MYCNPLTQQQILFISFVVCFILLIAFWVVRWRRLDRERLSTKLGKPTSEKDTTSREYVDNLAKSPSLMEHLETSVPKDALDRYMDGVRKEFGEHDQISAHLYGSPVYPIEESLSNEHLANKPLLGDRIKEAIKKQEPVEGDNFIDRENFGIYQYHNNDWVLIGLTYGDLVLFKDELYPRIEGFQKMLSAIEAVFKTNDLVENAIHITITSRPCGQQDEGIGATVACELKVDYAVSPIQD